MLKMLFGEPEVKPKDMYDMSREEVLSLTKKYLYSTYSVHEVDVFFETARALINELKIDDPRFDKKYDSIMIGVYVVARVIWQWHEDKGTMLYDKTFRELADMFGLKSFSFMGETTNDANNRALILRTGEKVLDGTLPFKAHYLADITLAQRYVPLLQRLNHYRPEIVDYSDDLSTREYTLIRRAERLQEENTALKKDLEAAFEKIAMLAPKAFQYDEAESEKQQNKGRFGRFGWKS